MYFHTSAVGFVVYFFLLFLQTTPVELKLVEEGVADRGALSLSLKTAPLDLLQDQSFEKLYRVVGSEDVFVRRAGGLRAVFRNPTYIETKGGSIALIPAGTVYCIGEVTPRVLRQLGMLIDPASQAMNQVEDVEPITPSHVNRVTQHAFIESTRSIRFLDDETYRRKRLASFVLELVLSN